MADPLWLDASTIIAIAKGDGALLQELLAMKRQFLISPKAHEEFTFGNPIKKLAQSGARQGQAKKDWQVPAESAAKNEAVLKQLNIQVDYMGEQKDRNDLM